MSECGFVPPQRRQVAAYGRPGLHPMRIARIDGFGCGFGDQGFQYVEGQFGPVQNLASQCVEVIDEIAGENRGQVKAYATSSEVKESSFPSTKRGILAKSTLRPWVKVCRG